MESVPDPSHKGGITAGGAGGPDQAKNHVADRQVAGVLYRRQPRRQAGHGLGPEKIRKERLRRREVTDEPGHPRHLSHRTTAARPVANLLGPLVSELEENPERLLGVEKKVPRLT